MRKVTQGLADSKGNKEHVFLSLGRLAAFVEESSPRILSPLSFGTVYVFTDASQEDRRGLVMGLGCTCYNKAAASGVVRNRDPSRASGDHDSRETESH